MKDSQDLGRLGRLSVDHDVGANDGKSNRGAEARPSGCEDQARHKSARSVERRANTGDGLVAGNALTTGKFFRCRVDEGLGPIQVIGDGCHQVGNRHRNCLFQ